MTTSPTLSPLDYQLQLPNRRKILAIYALTLLMYTVASPDPDPNPRGGGELPNPKGSVIFTGREAFGNFSSFVNF